MSIIDLKSNVNQNEIKDFVKEIQKEFPEYKIDENNVIDFSLLLESNLKCKSCKGLDRCLNEKEGYKLIFEDDSFKYSPCKYMAEKNKQNKNKNLIKTLYLPTKILEAKIEDYDVNTESRKKIFAKINEFISKTRNNEYAKGLYLYGTFSIGKTYTLACIANELARNNIESLLIYFPDLVLELKNSIKELRYHQLINKLKAVDVLMFDDFGSENVTPWLRDEVLGPILNYRALEKKPLFITSNIHPENLKNHFMCENTEEDDLKASRITNRLVSLVGTLNMNDSKKISR